MLYCFDALLGFSRLFTANINLVNNRGVICEEVLSRRYSAIPRLEDRGKLFLPFVVLSGNYGLARIIRRRFSRPSGWMGSTTGLRQIETNRSEPDERGGTPAGGRRDESGKAAETTTRK